MSKQEALSLLVRTRQFANANEYTMWNCKQCNAYYVVYEQENCSVSSNYQLMRLPCSHASHHSVDINRTTIKFISAIEVTPNEIKVRYYEGKAA